MVIQTPIQQSVPVNHEVHDNTCQVFILTGRTDQPFEAILRILNKNSAQDLPPLREEQLSRTGVLPPFIGMVILVRRRYRYEFDAGAEEPKYDGGSARMIRACHQQDAPYAAPGEFRAKNNSFLNRRSGMMAETLE